MIIKMDDQKTILKQAFDNLSTTAQKRVRVFITDDPIKELLSQYKIDEDNITNITDEALYILLDIEPLENFRSNLNGVSDLDSDVLDKIAENIDRAVFANHNPDPQVKPGNATPSPQTSRPPQTLLKRRNLHQQNPVRIAHNREVVFSIF